MTVMYKRLFRLACHVLVLGMVAPASLADVVGVGEVVMDGTNLVSATTADGYAVTTEVLQTGTTTAPGGEGAQYPPEWADDFDFSNAASNIYPLTTVLFGGELWFNSNGDAPDFFVFEGAGGRNVTDFRALFPDDTVGEALVVQTAEWLDTGVIGPFDPPQPVAGIAFSITDLKDAEGNNLPDWTELKGIVIGQSNTGVDPVVIAAVVGKIFVAHVPIPPDGALHANTWVNVSWKPGAGTISHDVYFGDNLDDVNNGTDDTFRGNQTGTFYVAGFPGYASPDGLVPGTMYYWRVDEVNDADPNSPWKGDVWSFLVPPKTAYNPYPTDGAEFVDPNAIFTWTGGYDSKLHTVYLGDNFDDVNNASGGMPLGFPTYDPGTLEREKVLYWRVDEFDGFESHKGDIWSFTTPGAVGNPQPANGAADVQMSTTLSWTPADNAASHELYFGTDVDAVKNATPNSPEYIGPRTLGAESYYPGGLAWDSSYAWRLDEVYPNGTVKGLVWSFSTADFILVDDFEAYNDIDPPDPASNTIFGSWADGYQIPTNGALTANEMPPYAEQTIVHGGSQSMKYLYDMSFMISESTLTLTYPKDWTEGAATKLSLWFRGDAANAVERMFVALNGTSVVYHDDPAATQLTGWKEWVIDLATFGVDLTNIKTITIGIGTKNVPAPGGGTGTVYFDDIRLVR